MAATRGEFDEFDDVTATGNKNAEGRSRTTLMKRMSSWYKLSLSLLTIVHSCLASNTNMAPPPTKSHVTGNDVPAHYIHADTAYFRDVHGRSLLLRGVNLSGSCKAPVGEPSQKLKGFWEAGESGDMSFVGRPLDLEDGSADVSRVV
jgi:hypothetical protein